MTSSEDIAALARLARELEAERDIRRIIARYGHYADTCQDQAYIDLFTEDAELDLSMHPDTPGDTARYSGKAAIARFIGKPGEHHRPGFYGRSMHVMDNNLVIAVTGDTATAESYNFTLERAEPGVRMITAASNCWGFRKVAGRWMITLRRRREMGTDAYTTHVAQPMPAGS